MKPVFFTSGSEFRKWLQTNHSTATELWVGMYRKDSGKRGITYPEALDEALCFGWIDGVRKSLDDERYIQRFSPRKKRSFWSAVNTKRAGELIAAGRMAPPGLSAFDARDAERTNEYSYERGRVELDPKYLQQFRRNKAAWAFFETQSPSYRRTVSWYVMSAKKEETRQRRLEALIASSAEKRRMAQLAPAK